MNNKYDKYNNNSNPEQQALSLLANTHRDYKNNISLWKQLRVAYEGGAPFIERSLTKHPRETIENFRLRLEKGVCINYCKSVVDLFNFFLTDDPPLRFIEGFETNEKFQAFMTDADLMGTTYNKFLNETQRLSSVYGTMGVIINKPQIPANIDDISVYPYVCAYSPESILDWELRRDEKTGRQELTYIKLKDGDEYLLYWKDRWERWVSNELWDQRNNWTVGRTQIKKNSSGSNYLGVIPFVWLTNIKKFGSFNMGTSDIEDLSLISSSVIRDFSRADEIIDISGFPMMRMPMEIEENQAESGEVVVSERSVLEFNPEFGDNGKPDWLKTEVKVAIEAILMLQDRKIEEAYKVLFLSGVHETRDKAQTKSATALRYQYQQLNALLINKANAMIHADREILKFFLLWENKGKLIKNISISRPQDFALGALVESLENAKTGLDMIKSKKFRSITKKNVVNLLHPNVSEKDFAQMSKEIDSESALEEQELLKKLKPKPDEKVEKF